MSRPPVGSNQPPFLAGLKRPDPEADHAALCSAEVRTERNCTSVLPLCLRGIDREKFAFYSRLK